MQRIGFSVHTGWAIYVIASGTMSRPEIHARGEISILERDDERFVFHQAATMKMPAAKRFIARVREKAIRNAKHALKGADIEHAVIVAKPGLLPPVEQIVSSHAKIHACEGMFFRDVLREAVDCDAIILSPDAIADERAAGWVKDRPWNRDHRLACVAALTSR